LKATEENVRKLNQFAERLSVDDIRYGKEHVDNRSLREKIRDDGWSSTNKDAPKTESDKLRAYLQDYRQRRKNETFEEKIENDIREAEIREEIAMVESERLEKAQPRIEHSVFQYLDLMFSDCPMSELKQAEKRMQVARDGTVADYKAACEEFTKRQSEAALIAKTSAERQFAEAAEQYSKKMADLNQTAWTETPPESTTGETT
jgi:hypothetical protein